MAETPQGDKPKKRNKVWLITIAVVLILAAGGALAYFLTRDTGDETTPDTTEQEELSPKFRDLYEKEKKEIEDRLAAAETPGEESEAYIDYANLERGEDNNDAALDYAQKAVDADETVDSLVALAFQAELAGNYELAADSYGKAAELVRREGGENSEYNYQVYMNMKEQMEQHGQ